jgi:hypothetical protein
MTLKIHYPFKPFQITQNWGNPNPAYNHFGFTKHNGIDARPWYQDAYLCNYYPVYCPVEGFRVDKVQYRPDGGGNEIWLVSKEEMLIGGEMCRAYLVLCHADKILVPVGYEPALGELIMIGDNTGFSTGTHTHMGLYRVKPNGGGWIIFDQNDANGSSDPALYFTGKFAADEASIPTLITSGMRYFKYRMGL